MIIHKQKINHIIITTLEDIQIMKAATSLNTLNDVINSISDPICIKFPSADSHSELKRKKNILKLQALLTVLRFK